MAVSDIDWSFWLAMPTIEAWQAIALTLDLDPDKMHQSPGSWMSRGMEPSFEDSSFPNALVEGEFNMRLRLFVASLPGRGTPRASARSPLRSSKDDVLLLAQIVEWLQRHGRTPLSTGLLLAIDQNRTSLARFAPHSPSEARGAVGQAEVAEATSKVGSSVPMPNAKRRRDVLDSVVKAAIEKAGCIETAAVWVHLRDLAVIETPPFSGDTSDRALAYTNAGNKAATFTKKALGQRLRRAQQDR